MNIRGSITKVFIAFAAAFAVSVFGLAAIAQQTQKTLLVNGADSPYSLDVYGEEAEDVGIKLRNLAVRATGLQRPSQGNIYIKTPVTGHFVDRSSETKAYSYALCGDNGECSTQGIIVLGFDPKTLRTSPLINVAYPYRNDILLTKVADIDHDGIDDVGVLSKHGNTVDFRILSFANKKFASAGTFRVYDLDAEPAYRTKLFVETGGNAPIFSAEKEIITAKGWTAAGNANVTAQPDSTAYSVKVDRPSVFKLLIFLTFVIQIIGFLILLAAVIYEFVGVIRDPVDRETDEAPPDGKKTLPPKPDDGLPKLDPITCLQCGAPLPLNEGEITCPSCGAKTTAPRSYFDVAQAREALREKIREAAAYLRRANIVTSGWMRLLVGLLAVWTGAALVAMFVFGQRDNFQPYQNWLIGRSYLEYIVVFGTATTIFWVIALGFTLLVWSPRIRRNIPDIDLGENLGEAGTAECPQCGGGISYQRDDLATVCGYCGVEVYRARLAWKFYNVKNEASQKADVSLVQAKEAAAEAVEDVTGTPKIFMFLLILLVIVYGVAWLVSAGYNLLPDSLRSIVDFIGDVLDVLT